MRFEGFVSHPKHNPAYVPRQAHSIPPPVHRKKPSFLLFDNRPLTLFNNERLETKFEKHLTEKSNKIKALETKQK